MADEKFVKFIRCTRTKYDGLASKEADALYFLTDEKTVMQGDALYSGAFEVVEFFPETGLRGRLYLTAAGDAKFWTGSAWIPLSLEVVQTIGENPSTTAVPSEKAVRDFVNGAISESGTGSVSAVSMTNGLNAQLSVRTGTAAPVLTNIEGLFQSISYSGGKLVLKSSNKTDAEVDIPVENFLSTVARHVVSGEEAGTGIYAGIEEGDLGILFTMKDGTQMFVKLSDLVDTYVADNSAASGITVEIDGYNISAVLNFDASEFELVGGKLTVKAIAASKITGLSDALSGKMNKLPAAAADYVLLGGATAADAKSSGKKIGGSTLAATPNADMLATEAAVKAAVAGVSPVWQDI